MEKCLVLISRDTFRYDPIIWLSGMLAHSYTTANLMSLRVDCMKIGIWQHMVVVTVEESIVCKAGFYRPQDMCHEIIIIFMLLQWLFTNASQKVILKYTWLCNKMRITPLFVITCTQYCYYDLARWLPRVLD